MVLFGEHMFLDPTTCGYRVWKYSQRCMVHLAKNCIGTGYVFMLLFDTPFPGLKQHYNSVWRDSTPNWILDGFKFQTSTGSVVSHG